MLYNRINKNNRKYNRIHKYSWFLLIFIIIVSALTTNYFTKVNAQTINGQEINQTINETSNISFNQTITLLNSSLILWHTNNTFVNETIFFYASYKNETNNQIHGNCSIKIENQTNLMQFNQTNYYFEKIFNENKSYNYYVNCSSNIYKNQSKTEIIIINLKIDNITQSNLTQNQTNNQTNNSTNQNSTTQPNIFDKDNDGFTNETDCNDENPYINPGKQEILYNSIDDDCNSGTLDYLIFNVYPEKQNYLSSELVKIRIEANNHSDTYLTINTPSNISYIYIFSNASYPITHNFSITQLSGKYTIEAINYYGNYTNQKLSEFNITNSMNIEIETNATEVYENEKIHFKAIITGNIGNVNMIWKMDDNNEIYQPEFDYNYSYARIYNVVLLATDQGGNQVIKTKQIIVNKQYFLRVKAIDNSTNEAILNASVRLNDKTQKVNSTGETEFKITNKTYTLRVSAENYYTYEDELKINNSLIFTVKLVKNEEDVSPIITIISPENNSNLQNPEFKFKFLDNNKADCYLLVSEQQDWWEEVYSNESLLSNVEYIFKPVLENKSYYWKLKCIDEDGNIVYTPNYYITIQEQNSVNYENTNQNNLATQTENNENESIETTYQVVQNVYNVIPDFETYSPDDKKIVDYLNMEALIKDAKRKLEMANRDLFNLRYQPDTDSILKARDEIYQRIEKIKDETPLSVSVKKKVDFIKYVDDSEIESLFNEYEKLKNYQFTNAEKKKLIEENKILQKRANIQTNAYNVEITYISGRKEEISLITREIDSDLVTGIMYVEFIPKEIVETTDNIVFITQPEKILQKDPVFEYDLSKTKEIVYYIKDSVSLDTLPKIKPVLFTIKTSETNKITGFSVFDAVGFSETNKKIFIIELIIIFILLNIYLYFYFKNSTTEILIQPNTETSINNKKQLLDNKNISNISSSNNDKINYIKSMLIKAESDLKSDKIQDASLKYYELKFLYDLLNENEKLILYKPLFELLEKITYHNINELLDESFNQLIQKNYDVAFQLYDEIQIEYNKLSKKMKNKIYSRCCELALHLKNEAK